MNLFSYLLGYKKGKESSSGGGSDINNYFVENGELETNSGQFLIKKFPFTVDLKHRADTSNLFSGFKSLEEISIINGDSINNASYMFGNCISLAKMDIRDVRLTNIGTGSGLMFGSTSSNRVPYSCLIVVKDNEQKEWMTTNYSNYTNVMTAEEYDAI